MIADNIKCVDDVLGEDEPLASHVVDSDIKVLEKDSLIINKVSNNFVTFHAVLCVEELKLNC